MHSAIAVANYFLDVAKRHKVTLEPMKLQKLVYIAHGWHLGLRAEPLIKERVQAWRWGPVIPTLYHEFKGYGDGPITGKGSEYNYLIDGLSCPEVEDEDTHAFLNKVWESYCKYTGIQLSNLTHQPDTPWTKVLEKHGGKIPRHANIDDGLILDHYEQLAER